MKHTLVLVFILAWATSVFAKPPATKDVLVGGIGYKSQRKIDILVPIYASQLFELVRPPLLEDYARIRELFSLPIDSDDDCQRVRSLYPTGLPPLEPYLASFRLANETSQTLPSLMEYIQLSDWFEEKCNSDKPVTIEAAKNILISESLENEYTAAVSKQFSQTFALLTMAKILDDQAYHEGIQPYVPEYRRVVAEALVLKKNPGLQGMLHPKTMPTNDALDEAFVDLKKIIKCPEGLNSCLQRSDPRIDAQLREIVLSKTWASLMAQTWARFVAKRYFISVRPIAFHYNGVSNIKIDAVLQSPKEWIPMLFPENTMQIFERVYSFRD